SRLDRIYVQHSIFDSCRQWNIEKTAIKSDHSIVTVQVVCRTAEKPGERPL
ncbi:hypothetical protein R3P38DRAFT_2582991, partial [Favolaschia claudopus]